MAMNKAEKARMDDLAEQASFHRTAPVPFDVAVPTFPQVATGWLFYGADTNRPCVERAWSKANTHGYGLHDSGNRSASQGGRPLFSTEARALAALRYAVEQDCQRRLRAVDIRIEMAAEKALA